VERDTMNQPPRPPQASLFSGGMGWHVLWVGLFIGLITLAIGVLYFDVANKVWQTMMFTTLAFVQIGQALASRSTRLSLFKLGLRSNPTLLVMVLLTFGLQLAAIYLPFLDEFFEVQPLSTVQLLICILAGIFTFLAIEGEKWLQQK